MSNEIQVSRFKRRYHLAHELGEGGMGVVHQAVDRLTGHTVALKQIKTMGNNQSSHNDDLRLSIVREFKVLAGLHHPHIISVMDFGFDETQLPYYTMEYLENAQTLSDAVVATTQTTKIEYVAQALNSLVYLHRHDVLHRDLKPDNILVADNKVKVLDFGLALLREQAKDADTAGTLAYIAPELFMGEPASESSDLYAMGVIIYELISGHHPFGDSTKPTFIAQVIQEVPEFYELDVDEALLEVIEKLLAKEPENRYQNAMDVLRDLADAVPNQIITETITIRESFLKSAPFVGRDGDLNFLLQQVEAAVNGKGSGWLIGGESGVGKSRFLGELRIHMAVKGIIVLEGQAVEDGGNTYQIWRDILRRLCVMVDISKEQASVIKSLVPDIEHLLGVKVPDAPTLEKLDDAQKRLFDTIEQLICQGEPIALVLEDLQWADEMSLKLLDHLSELTDEIPLLIIGSYRDDECPDLPSELPRLTVRKLGRLTETGVKALADAMLGKIKNQSEIVYLLQRETEGNAFFLVEIVRALAEEAGDLSKIKTMELPAVVVAGGINEIVKRRIGKIPPEDYPLLQLAAIMGKQLDLSILDNLGESQDISSWLTRCQLATVLEINDGVWRFSHDKLRQGVITAIPDDKHVELHRQVAESLETIYPDDKTKAPALAHHWEQAQDLPKAAYWHKHAGKQAQAAYAPADAITHYQKSLEYLPKDDAHVTDEIEIYDGLGLMLRMQIRLDEGLDVYTKMQARADSIDDRVAQIRAWLGLRGILDRQGKWPDALECVQKAQTLLDEVDEPLEAEKAEAFVAKAWTFYRLRDLDAALEAANTALEFCDKNGHLSKKGRSLSLIGIVHTKRGNYGDAIRYMSEALVLSRTLGIKQDIGVKLNNLGDIERIRGNFDSAAVHHEEAVKIFSDIGYKEGVQLVLTNLSSTRISLGDYDKALDNLERVLDLNTSDDWWALSEVFRLQAEAYLGENKAIDAVEPAKKALVEGRKNKTAEFIGKAWHILGKVAIKQFGSIDVDDEWLSVPTCFEKSLEIFDKDSVERAKVLYDWAQYDLDQDETEAGISRCHTARNMFLSVGVEHETAMHFAPTCRGCPQQQDCYTKFQDQ